MTAPNFRGQITLVFVLSLAVFQGTILWLDNVHIATANGLYKSLQAAPWIANPSTARLDASNYLYFPLYGLSCRLLDGLGIWRGVAWKQLAVLNAFWASVCVSFVYVFIHRVTGNARAAALAACFHVGSGFVLLLAVINEDIMPGYTLVFGAMALAALWFDRPTARRVIAVGALFTLGWLIEWRLMFPALPALILALLMAPQSPRRRLALIGVLLVSVVSTAGLVCLFWEGHNGAMGLHDILWTGKGVATGWAGFSTDKLWALLSGLSNYFLLTWVNTNPGTARDAALALSIPLILEIAILAVATAALWPRRHDPRLRAIAAVFMGTAGAGTIFNFYSQPQDPQMQINVMPWLTVAWGLLAAMAMGRGRVALLVVLSVAPLAWNLASLGKSRGKDSTSVAAVAAIERQLPPASTVFLYWGFESIVAWQYALWSHTWDWDGSATVTPAPSAAPKFKWIAVTADAIRRPQSTADEHAARIKRDIDLALERGYRVVAGAFWEWNVAKLSDQLGAISASGRAAAIHAMLHDSFEARPVFMNDMTGPYYELKRR